MTSRCVLCLTWLLAGCATQTVAQTPRASAAEAKEKEPRARPSRDLLADATFGELVKGISLDELREVTPRRCLLARTQTGYRLEAELAVAVHPIATPPEDLDAPLAESDHARMLSRWGRHGSQASQITLAALTDTPPTRAAWALLMTDRGLYLRPSDAGAAAANVAMNDGALAEALRSQIAQSEDVTLFVSAEHDVRVSRIEQVLKQLSAQYRGPVTLAVALSTETALPAPRSTSAAARRCPEGLPESVEVQGDLTVAALTEAMVPLRTRAATCLEHADARGAAGGRLLLGLRIRQDGSVEHACMVADETEDDALAACVLAAAHDLRFPVPDPAGYVDVELPLVLRPNSAPAQAPVCEPTQTLAAP